MVDLNRGIKATQARQGGFSAHVMPAATEYRGQPNLLLWVRNQIEDISVYGGSVSSSSVNLDSSEFKFLPPSFEFNGIGKIDATIGVQINNVYPLPIALQDFTIEFWLRHESSVNDEPDQWETLFTFSPAGQSIDILNGHINLWEAGGKSDLLDYIPSGGAEADMFLVHQTSIPPFLWTHISLQRKGSNAILFVNGQPSNASYNFDESIGNSFIFGNWIEEGFDFVGRMQHFKVWHGAIYPPTGFTPPTMP